MALVCFKCSWFRALDKKGGGIVGIVGPAYVKIMEWMDGSLVDQICGCLDNF
jgi:hypothetical protein